MPTVSDDIRDGLRQGGAIAAVLLAVGLPGWTLWHRAHPAASPAAATASSAPRSPSGVSAAPDAAPAAPVLARRFDMAGVAAPQAVVRVARWAVDAGDHRDAPFAVVDKRHAHVYVFDASGRLAGHSPVLLGYAAGDDSVPGIGNRPIEQVRPQERTTPAGRFVAEPGRNALQQPVVWVDYAAAVSMHKVRTTNPAEHRLERLATPSVRDNRISYGCINLPPQFFDQVAWPLLGRGKHVVYVLPERKPLLAVFPALRTDPTGMAPAAA